MENKQEVNLSAVFESQGSDLSAISRSKAIIYEKYVKSLEKIKQLEDYIEKQQAVIDAYESKEEVGKGGKNK